jgi:hypothetical protein
MYVKDNFHKIINMNHELKSLNMDKKNPELIKQSILDTGVREIESIHRIYLTHGFNPPFI